MKDEAKGMIFNVIVKKEDDLFVAHCLELDIVATAKSQKEVEKDMADLIVAQVDYAFTNDNLEHLYRPAPKEVWKEFYECKGRLEKKHRIQPKPKKSVSLEDFVPPSITTLTCNFPAEAHV